MQWNKLSYFERATHIRGVIEKKQIPTNDDESLIAKAFQDVDFEEKMKDILEHFMEYGELNSNLREYIYSILGRDSESKRICKILDKMEPRRQERGIFNSIKNTYNENGRLLADSKERINKVFRLRHYRDRYKALLEEQRQEENIERLKNNKLLTELIDEFENEDIGYNNIEGNVTTVDDKKEFKKLIETISEWD